MTDLSRRALLGMSAGAGLAATVGVAPRPAPAADSPIVKPLPDAWFIVYGSNAETRWEALAGTGYHTPIDRFFVRDHTSTPRLDASTWSLKLHGTGLRGAPTEDEPVVFTYEDLRALPSRTVTAFIECAGNGRGFYTTQQNQSVSGTAWRLGAVGVARWRGVPLAEVLHRAGITPDAVDVMPRGLDDEWTDAGVNHGHVRRPLPVAKALDDVLLAYEMNGETLPYDHGYPVRVVVPNWVGIANIKWVGDIEVSAEKLSSPWDTQYYRLFGPGYPPEGSDPLTRQVTKSAFELPWDARLAAGKTHVLHGRSWSGNGPVRRVEVSTDGGATWHRAAPSGPALSRGWLPWTFRWRPSATGTRTLLARATDANGTTQADTAPYNTLGYLFGAVVKHPVTVA